MNHSVRLLIPLGLVLASSLTGCATNTEQGALFGGLSARAPGPW